MMMMRIVAIGDFHARPAWYFIKNEDGKLEKKLIPMRIANRRADWLALLIIDILKTLGPNEELTIVDIGDFADMKSLSSYDKGKRPGENERIQLDIDYARDARQRITKQVLDYIEQLKIKRRRVPKVRWIALLGNHENRWERLKKDDALWDIFDGVSDISGAKEWGWEVIPFLTPIKINGVWFCHYFESGPKGFAISGVTPGRSLIAKMKESCVVGHSHEYHMHVEQTVLSTKIGMQIGCYLELEEDYAGPQGNHRWWKGIVEMKNVRQGSYNEIRYPIEDIQKKYYLGEEIQGPYNLKDMGVGRELVNFNIEEATEIND